MGGRIVVVMGSPVLQTFVVVVELVSRLELLSVRIQSNVFDTKPVALFDVSDDNLDCVRVHG